MERSNLNWRRRDYCSRREGLISLRSTTKPGHAGWLLLALAALVVWNAPAAQAQSSDPFGTFQGDLARAADFHLEQVQEISRRATAAARQNPTAPAPEPSPPWRAAFGASSWERLRAPQERLRTLGVDAAEIFAEEGVPRELLVVAAVESSYDPLALSSRGARGLWQLMPETAARLGLRVGQRVDERVHPVRSTRAAARYLRELYLEFGDWLLALAAYNAGEARVAAAIERAGTRDFWRLAAVGLLPEETRRYVPAVLLRMVAN